MYEIERKFLITYENKDIINTLNVIDDFTIEQCYVYFDDTEELRLRKIIDKNNNVSYFITYKREKQDSLCRLESENTITETMYNSLSEGLPILKKQRKIVNIKKNENIFIDIYNNDLCICEIEFDNVKDAFKFIPYNFMGPEITDDMNYRNKNLYKMLTTVENKE